MSPVYKKYFLINDESPRKYYCYRLDVKNKKNQSYEFKIELAAKIKFFFVHFNSLVND